MSKKIRFTNKGGLDVMTRIGGLGQYVFGATGSVNETNDAIRWCNKHGVGERFECDEYVIEIIGED